MATFAEDELGRKFDLCIKDALLKVGGGTLLGGLFCIMFARRSKWPIFVGTGLGLGMAVSNCQQSINSAIRTVPSSNISKKVD